MLRVPLCSFVTIACAMRLKSAFSAVQLCQSHGQAAQLTGSHTSVLKTLGAFHTCVSVLADSKAVKKGKERQASAASQLAEILPQNPTPPQRTAEELQDAEARVKEYSRQRMKELRAHQKMQKERRSLRDQALLALPPDLRMSALQPVPGVWPLKMLPPFATPPRAPKWRM